MTLICAVSGPHEKCACVQEREREGGDETDRRRHGGPLSQDRARISASPHLLILLLPPHAPLVPLHSFLTPPRRQAPGARRRAPFRGHSTEAILVFVIFIMLYLLFLIVFSSS